MEQQEKQEEKDIQEEAAEGEAVDEVTNETGAVEEDAEADAEALIEEPVEEPDDLERQLETALQEAAEHKDSWMRTQAEFQNYRKRIEREQVKMREDAAVRVIKHFLDVLDDIDRALANRPAEGEGADWAEGIELIYRKLQTILENEGVVQMQAEGEQFDPNLHEAIAQEESPDHESGQVIEELQKGYMIGERVLRPALVRIAS